MREYSTVVLRKPLAEAAVPIGTRGVVLMAFDSPSRAYEVEFLDSAARSLGTFTVNEEQIEEWDAENERAD